MSGPGLTHPLAEFYIKSIFYHSIHQSFAIISVLFACRVAYSVQLPSYTLFFDGNPLASNARKIMLAVTPGINIESTGIYLCHTTL
jgi:hypothetical protein